MQPIESECDACGELVRTTADGDACGGCEVTICRDCLRGTARCPSCQKRFADTRGRQRAAVSAPVNYTRVMGILALLGLVGAFVYVQAQTEPNERRSERTQLRGLVADRARAPVALSCATVQARYAASFDRLSGFRLVPNGPDAIAPLLEPALALLDARVRPLGRVAGYPLEDAVGAVPDDGYGMHFNVTGWADPRVGEQPSGGRVTGRMFIERQSPRQMLCVAEVDHRGSPPDGSLSPERALGAARIALILGALEAGAESLVAAR